MFPFRYHWRFGSGLGGGGGPLGWEECPLGEGWRVLVTRGVRLLGGPTAHYAACPRSTTFRTRRRASAVQGGVECAHRCDGHQPAQCTDWCWPCSLALLWVCWCARRRALRQISGVVPCGVLLRRGELCCVAVIPIGCPVPGRWAKCLCVRGCREMQCLRVGRSSRRLRRRWAFLPSRLGAGSAEGRVRLHRHARFADARRTRHFRPGGKKN